MYFIVFSFMYLIPQMVKSTASGYQAPWGPGIGLIAKEDVCVVNERGGCACAPSLPIIQPGAAGE